MTAVSSDNVFLETVEIAHIRRNAAKMFTAYCDDIEEQWVKTAPLQTLAGQVALKTALARLTAELFEIEGMRPEDFIIGRQPSGAPVIAGVKGISPEMNETIKRQACVSISHTDALAVGLAFSRRPLNG